MTIRGRAVEAEAFDAAAADVEDVDCRAVIVEPASRFRGDEVGMNRTWQPDELHAPGDARQA